MIYTKTLFLLATMFVYLSACDKTTQMNTDSLNDLLDKKLLDFKSKVGGDGSYFDMLSIQKGLTLIRGNNSDKNTKNKNLVAAFNKALHWDSFNLKNVDSISLIGHVNKISSATNTSDALIAELCLYDYIDNLVYKNYYHFRYIKPVVFGSKKPITTGDSDTLRFIIAGQSGSLRNSVYLGDIDSLKDASYRETLTPIYDDVDEDENSLLLSKFVIKGDKKGKHKLTGVIEKPDKGQLITLPFKYEYIVK